MADTFHVSQTHLQNAFKGVYGVTIYAYMLLEDCTTSRETDGNFNEEYCKWCYADGEYTLDIWKRYAEIGGKEKLEEFKQQLIHEFNTLLHIEGLPKVENLNVLSGEFINMEYTLPNG